MGKVNIYFVLFSELFLFCFIWLCVKAFFAILNVEKLGKVLRWRLISVLQPNKAGIFVFNLFVYKKLEFSEKLI